MTWTTVSDQAPSWTTQSDNSAVWASEEKRKVNLLGEYSDSFSRWYGTAVITETTKTTSLGSITVSTLEDNSSSVSLGTGRLQRYIDSIKIPEAKNTDTRCFSVYVEKDSTPAATRYGVIRIGWNTAAISADLRFDTQTGETVFFVTGDCVVVNNGADDYGDFWRFWISAYSISGEFYRINIWPAFGDTSLQTATSAAITGSISCCLPRLEFGDSPSLSYDRWINQ